MAHLALPAAAPRREVRRHAPRLKASRVGGCSPHGVAAPQRAAQAWQNTPNIINKDENTLHRTKYSRIALTLYLFYHLITKHRGAIENKLSVPSVTMVLT